MKNAPKSLLPLVFLRWRPFFLDMVSSTKTFLHQYETLNTSANKPKCVFRIETKIFKTWNQKLKKTPVKPGRGLKELWHPSRTIRVKQCKQTSFSLFANSGLEPDPCSYKSFFKNVYLINFSIMNWFWTTCQEYQDIIQSYDFFLQTYQINKIKIGITMNTS